MLLQCRWAGRDVAVKVIEHNTDTTVPVEREVTLMLSFNHPNIVRAYHFVTRVHTSEVRCHRPTALPCVCVSWLLVSLLLVVPTSCLFTCVVGVLGATPV